MRFQETLLQIFQKRYEERERELGEEVMREIERLILLDRIDYHWMSHLHNIDYIQEGIGFRGYAGRDPLIEFQNEGFALFSKHVDAHLRGRRAVCVPRSASDGAAAARANSQREEQRSGAAAETRPPQLNRQKSGAERSLSMRQRQEIQTVLRAERLA